MAILPQTQLFTNVLASNQIELKEIHNALPQLQCGRCDTPGCMEYAQAILDGTPHNRCLPGGHESLNQLNKILNSEINDLDNDYGPTITNQILVIDEDICIGCAKCIPKCPVDAIIGAPNKLHQIDTNVCTGCELCIEPCPVDCINIKPVSPKKMINAKSSSQERYDSKRSRSEKSKEKLSLDVKSNLEIANYYKNLKQ